LGDDDDDEKDPKKRKKPTVKRIVGPPPKPPLLSPRVMDAVLTTVMGLAAVGLGGVLYQTW